MNKVNWPIVIAVLAVLSLVGVVGYNWRGARNQEAITTATSNEAVCQSALEGKGAAIKRLEESLSDLRDRHKRALAAAAETLAQRDADIAALKADVAARTTALRKFIHDDAECASLGRMPVCADVARQLWPAASQAGTDDHAN